MPLFLVTFQDGTTSKVGACNLSAAGQKAAKAKNQVPTRVEPIVDYWDVGGMHVSDAVLTLRLTLPPCIEILRRAAPVPPTRDPDKAVSLNELVFTLGNVFQKAVDCNVITASDCCAVCRWVGTYRGSEPGDLVEAIWFERAGW